MITSDRNRYALLRHPQFIAGMFVILINDLFLKTSYHNWITGKLSDIAGLYVFPVFWCAFFPAYKKHIYVLTAIIFTVWKSSLSQPLIIALNNINLPFNRVIDPTDLLALFVLPISFKYCHNTPTRFMRSLHPALIAIPALVIFCNDSIVRQLRGPGAQYNYGKRIETQLSASQLFARLDSLGIRYYPDSVVSGNYFYDTSMYTIEKTIIDRRTVTRFWRIKNYACGSDTIRNINFTFGGNAATNWVQILGYDVNDLSIHDDLQAYNKQEKIYRKLLRDHFANLLQ